MFYTLDLDIGLYFFFVIAFLVKDMNEYVGISVTGSANNSKKTSTERVRRFRERKKAEAKDGSETRILVLHAYCLIFWKFFTNIPC